MARPTRRPGNLPAETSSFIGRRREIAELRKRLATARLVTLVGPGGVGKTRLALRVGTDLSRGSRDGVWMVELADVRDPGLVPNAVLAALDLRDQSAIEPRDLLLARLREQEVLLIVDNCEHLLGAAAALVAAILRTAPGVRVIATSREPLSVPGEHVLPVPPLELPSAQADEPLDRLASNESVGLFIERAAAAAGRFDLVESDRAAVVDLCRRLDGLPLAIELAAVRTRVLSVKEIDARLADRFGLLAVAGGTAPHRHRALWTTVEWSHDLLGPDERTVFRRLCAFAGRFALGDVEAVCTSDDVPAARVLDLLSSLVDKSLVLKEDAPGRASYRLHETMREFAAHKTREAGEAEALELRCADHFVTTCGRRAATARFELVEWLGWMEIEIDTIRSVLRQCLVRGDVERATRLAVSAAWFWITRATAEGVRWLDEVLALQAGAPAASPAHAGALFMRGFLAVIQADPATARNTLERAAAAFRQIGLPGPLVNALSMGSFAANMTGDRDAARRLLDEARDIAAGLDDVEAATAVLQAKAMDGLLAGDMDGVVRASAEGACISRASGDLYTLDIWLMNQGIAALIAGRPEDARPLIAEALSIAHRIDDRVSQFHLLDGYACLAVGSGRARLAAQLLGAATTVGEGAGARVMPFLAPLVEQAQTSAVAALGRPRFDAAFLAGSRMDRDAAVRLALGRPGEGVGAREGADIGPLSKRESEVALLVADGLTNKEIAARLFISEYTVDSHVRGILNKLGVDSRARIAAWVASGRT